MRSTGIYGFTSLVLSIIQVTAAPTLQRRQELGADPVGWNIVDLSKLEYEESVQKQHDILTAAFPDQGVFIVHDTPSVIPDERLVFRRHTEPVSSSFWGTTYGYDAFVVSELGGTFTFAKQYNQEYKLGGRYHQYLDQVHFCPKGKQSYELNTKTWMSRIDGSLPLSGFSIPGTHDSASNVNAVNWVPELGGTQSSTITEQLDNGIRFFDIRIGSASNPLKLRHGKVEVSGVAQDVFKNFNDFLAANPSEAILCSIKWDFEDAPAPADLDAQLQATWSDGQHGTWLTDAALPTLDTARGKIVLLRRYGGSLGFTLNVDDNTVDQEDPNGLYRVQDHYTPALTADGTPDWDNKWNAVKGFLDTAKDFGSTMLSLNFLSAVNVASLTVLFKPADWANEINARLQQWLDTVETKKINLGVVILDFENGRSGDWSFGMKEAIASSGQNLLQLGGTVALTQRIILTNFD